MRLVQDRVDPGTLHGLKEPHSEGAGGNILVGFQIRYRKPSRRRRLCLGVVVPIGLGAASVLLQAVSKQETGVVCPAVVLLGLMECGAGKEVHGGCKPLLPEPLRHLRLEAKAPLCTWRGSQYGL